MSRALAIASLLVGLAIAFGAYQLGQQRAGFSLGQSQDEYAALERELNAARIENRRLRERVAVLETDAKIDAESYRQVESQLGELQATIVQQQEDLNFYKGIVSPEDAGTGLRIQDFQVSAAEGEGAWKMRLVLAQALRNDKRIKGGIDMRIEGQRAGQAVTLAYSDVAAPDEERALAFSFRYFQDLHRRLRLPDGFEPERVVVRLQPSGRRQKSVERTFNWPPRA